MMLFAVSTFVVQRNVSYTLLQQFRNVYMIETLKRDVKARVLDAMWPVHILLVVQLVGPKPNVFFLCLEEPPQPCDCFSAS